MSCYFKDGDFARCCPPCKLSDMSEDLLDILDYARSLYGRPMIITSAYRSKDYEHLKGRSGSSSHCKGVAVDIACHDSTTRLQMLLALTRAGFRRIGIGPNFIHVDVDESKAKTCWLY